MSASAQTVEVAKGVQVTKKTYDAPVNEKPFFGFADKSPAQREADEKFVAAVLQATGSRQKAFDETTLRGWRAITGGNAAEAARRFNQAYLIAPEQSELYHGLAVVTLMRFNDPVFADELFRIALRQPNPLKTLKADYGRFMLISKRPKDALPLLEQAVLDTPDFGDAWSNLAHARLQNGDRDAACRAADEALKQRLSANAGSDLAALKSQASCK
ncbi:tetratricopeptide repeat protein [Tardiphaga sp. 813_E8_N1_3]|uniref:tetratricopeptide repeat protein n=1 Tax=Tardiphaga sp. 813_E8_N1_3 TaxID=3240760 RepID=UPI003F25CCA8